jgi:hypothetical protein
MSELKRCPFCGGKAWVSQPYVNTIRIYCDDCPARLEQKVKAKTIDWLKANLADAWNKRVYEQGDEVNDE